MTRLLLLRFSAMGDVALLAPVIQAFTQHYPDAELTLVTRKKFAVFFAGFPNVRIVGADFDGVHKGFPGLFRLFTELRQVGPFSAVLDAHQNLRSAVLKTLFRAVGVPAFTIDKGRAEKKALTRKENKIRQKLLHSVERYARVFAQAGYPVMPSKPFSFLPVPTAETELTTFLRENPPAPVTYWLGIAPFAQHGPKMWPFEWFTPLLETLMNRLPLTIFLFGGGTAEISQLQTLREKFPQIILAAGQLSMAAELLLISRLNGMLCMDSGNMHLAALSRIPVLSIWGATHPDAGFGPWDQENEAILQIPVDELTCRPCSVFGNKPCWRGDLACMQWITVPMIAERVERMLADQNVR